MDNNMLMSKLKLGKAIQNIKGRYDLDDKEIVKLLSMQKKQIEKNIDKRNGGS